MERADDGNLAVSVSILDLRVVISLSVNFVEFGNYFFSGLGERTRTSDAAFAAEVGCLESEKKNRGQDR